ncbi:hypothetical protein [Candidatus Lokiarchaeum ossiferum]|uniref:hypothetical protein n=1 Tax=Candidatus Lokiarchaeum ossiferum TaxID=2951803 RepID=UPI00352F6A4D
MGKYKKYNDYDCTIESFSSALNNLDRIENASESLRFFMGFDGYVDLLYNMLKSRQNVAEYEIYANMADFGQRIVDTAGSSTSIERVLKKELAGGFAPNMARAIANMVPKSTIDLYAAMGYPEIDPLFQNLPSNVNLFSVANSGETLAMEFSDGKVMSQDMGGLFELDWNTLVSRMGGEDAVIEAFNRNDAIGNGHWSLMLHMNNYFEHFISDILPNVSNSQKKLFFVDPADFTKRSHQEIRKMLSLLGKIDEKIPVVLSLNDREAIDVSNVLNSEGVPKIQKGSLQSFEKAGQNINSVLNLTHLVIHEPHFATITGHENHFWVTEGYTSAPKFTVAAGDHFNAGILISKLSKLSSAESLIVANAATAIFVRTGQSPSISNLKKYISNYIDYIETDISTFEI